MPDSPVPLPSADPVQPGLTAISEDAQIIFKDVWLELEQDLGREYLRFAREIILLGAAPGAGKGTNTSFILKTRGLTCPPIVVSELLDSPEDRAIK